MAVASGRVQTMREGGSCRAGAGRARHRVLPAALALLSLTAAAGCGDTSVCTSSACTAALSFAPAQAVLEATQGRATAPLAVALSSASSSPISFSLSCTGGFSLSPASGSVSSAAPVALQLRGPAASEVGTITGTCSAAGAPSGSAALPVVQETSADLGDAGNGDGSGVGIRGGSVDHLYFAVVGDSRPADLDDTAGYPTAVIEEIYRGVDSLLPRPQFAVGTGDYMFAGPTAYTAQPQASLYMQARAAWRGTFFPAMGNHECDGYTADNCAVNQTQNNQAFMRTILGPNQEALPYYAVPIRALDASWTAKLLVIACNAWDPAQSSWLKAQLAQSTTYTLLVRHEPAEASTGPCVNEVEALMKTNPYDLSLVGHTHEFRGGPGAKEIVIGNGGAPLSSGTFGFTTIERVAAGWQVIEYDAATRMALDSFVVP